MGFYQGSPPSHPEILGCQLPDLFLGCISPVRVRPEATTH